MTTNLAAIGDQQADTVADACFHLARLLDIELGEPLPIIESYDSRTGHQYKRVEILTRLHGALLGVMNLWLEGERVGLPEYYPQIRSIFGEQID